MSEGGVLTTDSGGELRSTKARASDPSAEATTPQEHESIREEEHGPAEGDVPEGEEKGDEKSEPSPLPWPGDDELAGRGEEKGGGSPEEMEESILKTGNGSANFLENGSQAEEKRKRKSKWRDSMPEGERWRDYETELRLSEKGGGSLADDEEEEEGSVNWMPENAALVFTPQVNILNQSGKESPPREKPHYTENISTKEPQTASTLALQHYLEPEEEDGCIYLCGGLCSEKLKLCLATAAALVLFPLLVWGGYVLLPFDAPLIQSAPLRLVYTLRCAFFAVVPILLGVVVQGVARLRFGELKPLYEGRPESREVAAHCHYVNGSLSLYLFYFLHLSVMATYLNQDLLKLVPLLTIVFAFGRLIYWVCLSLGSSVRGLGFGLSFFPILAMLGMNLYYIFSSVGPGAVFDLEPPTTAPPMPRFWG